jgi:hypothetical protein
MYFFDNLTDVLGFDYHVTQDSIENSNRIIYIYHDRLNFFTLYRYVSV